MCEKNRNEYTRERNYFSMIEAESIIKTLNIIDMDESNLKRLKPYTDRLKRIVDRCIQNIDERGPEEDGTKH